MVSFNCNFEKESLNEAPRIGFMSTDQKNLSINIVQFPGYNQVLRMAKNGTLTNFPKLTLYTGNGYSSGIVDFEFDVNIEEMSSTAHGVQMNYGASGGSTSEHTIQFLKKNDTHGEVCFYDNRAYILYDTWHHLLFRYDLTYQRLTFNVDGAMIAVTEAYLPVVGVINIAFPGIDSIATMMLDNLKVSVHVPPIYPVFDPQGRVALSIMFDDANIHDLDVAAPVLGDAPASSNLFVGDIGDSGRLDWTDVQTLVDRGWEMLSHSLDHPHMTDCSEDEAMAQFELSKTYVEANTTAEVRGFVYPYNNYNYWLDQIGWNYYSYIGGGSPYDAMNRINCDVVNNSIGSSIGPFFGMYRIMRVLPAAIYGSNVHLLPYFHAIQDRECPTYGCNLSAFKYFIDELKSEGVWFTTPSMVQEFYRNAVNAKITGNVTMIGVEYPKDRGNYVNDSVWIHISGDFGEESYVVVDERGLRVGGVYSPVDNNLTVLLWSGNYSLMTLSDYIESQDRSNDVSALLLISTFLILSVAVIVGWAVGRRGER